MDFQKQYLLWKNNEHLSKDLKDQLLKMTEKEIEDAFYTDLKFGTGGMRGIVGPGTNRMNIYTIRKANVGFAQYLLERYEDAKTRGVVIAHDNRHYSKEFARESARVMASFGIKAYLFEDLRPTPELSYAVRHLGACGGIVVTASHNPPQYNGYKIYDENGCQLVPHLASLVIENIQKIDDIFNIELESDTNDLIQIIGKEVDDAYTEKVKSISINPDLDKSNIKIVFTPLHGTSNVLGRRVLKECGYEHVYAVEAQCTPDPNFSTVKSPNPENAEAFEMAIKLGEEVDADILIATDPDADRVGLAVKNKDNKYTLLSGNQTGAILLHYMLSEKQSKNSLPKNGVVYNTIVTSQLGALIAKHYGMSVESTLTGFKFIGEKAKEIEDTEKKFVFGYEESYGYLIADFVRDKDSIQAILMCAEAATYYKNQNKTLYDVLFEIYEQYGYYIESLVNITLEGKLGQETIQKILIDFREDKPTVVNNEKVKVVEDYLDGLRFEGDETKKLTLPKANVVKFILSDNSWFVLRPSGTEPKLKIYISVVSDSLEESETKNKEIKEFILNRVNKIK